MAALLFAAAAVAIYPDDHWSYSTKLTKDNIDSVIKENVESGKTLFAPAWNRVTKLFAKNTMVAFADVNLADDPIGGPYQAGAGGWPTVRYFNAATGIGGAPYTKKTGDAMCTELGNDKYMNEYVLEQGSTSLCDIPTKENCSDKELEYIEKFKGKPTEELTSQMERLRGMAGSSMKPELRSWLGQRMNALNQLKQEL